MDIPGVGSPRGILEIFFPGVFLLWNLLLVCYFLNPDTISRSFITGSVANVGLTAIAARPTSLSCLDL